MHPTVRHAAVWAVSSRARAGCGRRASAEAGTPGPGADEVFAGVGWRGTGYKFAPWVGRMLAQPALQQGTGYDIRRFAPARFAGGRWAGALKAGGAIS
jgi:glycine/D-amino acid oxidase-like deaminating enzyme